MALRVGIPGRFYYYYYPHGRRSFGSWERIRFSPLLRIKGLLKPGQGRGGRSLPAGKVYYGHVLELAAKVDYLFLPGWSA